LEIFVADPALQFEGLVRQPRTLERLLRFIGLAKGFRPIEHALFREYMVVSRSRGTGLELGAQAYCQALHEHLKSSSAWKLEFQAQTGITSFACMPRAAVTSELLDARTRGLMRCIETRST